MTGKVANSSNSSVLNSHLHPYLAMENEVHDQCIVEKEKLKSDLLNAVRDLADKKQYSPIEAKVAATSLVQEKLEQVMQRMKADTADPDRQEVIQNIWHVLRPELFSPFRYKGILESILKGESVA